MPVGNRDSLFIGRILGIDIRLHYTWFVVLALVTWSLAAFYFPSVRPDWSRTTYWAAGLVTAVLFFSSVLFHELSHSYVAQRQGIAIKDISLFIFGGVARITEEPRTPQNEAAMAAAGPAASFLLALGFWIISALPIGDVPATIAGYLALINGLLAAFNLLPGFPLDGGRILRAILWCRSGNLARATGQAASVGWALAYLIILWGVIALFSGAVVAGLWRILLGWFLDSAARSGYQQVLAREVLQEIPVGSIMERRITSISPDLPLPELIDRFLLGEAQGSFPVAEEGKLVGIITLEDVRTVPRDKRDSLKVRDAMTPVESLEVLELHDNAFHALQKMGTLDVRALPVVRARELQGLVSRSHLLQVLAVKMG